MPNSQAFPTRASATCLECGRRFDTEYVEVLGRRFLADRFCDVCRFADEAAAAEKQAELRWKRANVPAAYRECSFENFEPVSGAREAAQITHQWVREYRAGARLKRGLCLYGPPGAGKTHLAVAILREAVYCDRGARPLFLNVPEWLNLLRESIGDNEREPPPSPNGYDILVLDDLGAEHWSDWARDRIFSVINHRDQRGLLTIATTNSTPRELGSRVGSPTSSRLYRLCREVRLETRQDFRKLQIDRQAE